MNKPVPRPRSVGGKPSSKPVLPPSVERPRKPPSRPGQATVKPRTPPRDAEAVEVPEGDEHPSSKVRRPQALRSAGGGDEPGASAEPLDRSMRPAGLSLAAKFAMMIGATVATTSLIMALAIYRSVSSEVDKEINEAGVRTTRILCGLDAATIRGTSGGSAMVSEFNKLAPAVNEYVGFVTETIQELLNRTGVELPENMNQEKDAKYKAVQDALKSVADEMMKSATGGGIFSGQSDVKKMPGVINVIITDPQNKQLAILDATVQEVRLGKTRPLGEQNEVSISEGAYNGRAAREYKSTLRDKEGNPVGIVRLYLSAVKIEQVKGQLFTAMLIPLLISVLLGIGIAVFIAARVTKPIQLLLADINVVSGGDLEHQTMAHSKDEIGVLAKAFDRMTKGLKEAHRIELEQKATEHEMSIAAEIQSNLLPKKIPKYPGYDISAYYRPSKEVGGDMYDFIPIDQENLGILVADVSGKGVPGSMIMTMARSLLRMEGERNLSTAATLVKTNRILARDIRRGMFVTCMYMILNVRQKTLLISSAGHNPLVVFRKNTGQIELVNPNGIALGFDKGPIFERTVKEQRIQLYTGDRFCAYTDGVPEAMSPEDEEFGDDRFYALCKTLAGLDSNQFVNRIVKELDDHKQNREQHDDITIVTARLQG